MSLTIDLPMEMQKRLVEKAREKGVTVKSYLEELVQTDIETNGKNGTHSPHKSSTTNPISTEQWIAEFRAWTASHRHLPHEADDSRESIYAGTGE